MNIKNLKHLEAIIKDNNETYRLAEVLSSYRWDFEDAYHFATCMENANNKVILAIVKDGKRGYAVYVRQNVS